MLWYKAWLETRSRFLISLVGIVSLCSTIVWLGDLHALSYSKADFYYGVLGSGNITLATTWFMAVTLLMMGGLLRERASGAAPFTLTLPVSRASLMRARISVGVVQAIALGVIPWCAMFLIGTTVGKTHLISQAALYIVFLLGGGSFFFALAFLISSVIEGEYTAPIVSFGIAFGIFIAFDGANIGRYSPWTLFTGFSYFNRQTGMLGQPFPWGLFAGTLLISATMVGIAVKVSVRQEF